MPRALITGITGQDGSYLAELLLDKGYEVCGLARRESWSRPNPASHLAARIGMQFGDVTDVTAIVTAVRESRADEIYNLASQSRPGKSWAQASETLLVNGLAALHLFEAVRHASPRSRVFHASSSEMFGSPDGPPQNERTALNPHNPYAAAKVYAHQMARIYREHHGLFIATGILFNHESERRPLHFVTQKIAYGAACAALGITDSPDPNELGRPIVEQGRLALGNLEVARDWGHARDFVRGMWLILQQDAPGDFVVGTGELHTLKELCDVAYGHVGKDWSRHVVTDSGLLRAHESAGSIADAGLARRQLGWQPVIGFESMVQGMVDAQIERLRAAAPRRDGT